MIKQAAGHTALAAFLSTTTSSRGACRFEPTPSDQRRGRIAVKYSAAKAHRAKTRLVGSHRHGCHRRSGRRRCHRRGRCRRRRVAVRLALPGPLLPESRAAGRGGL